MNPITLETLLAAYKAVLENEHSHIKERVEAAQAAGVIEDFTFFTDGRSEAYIESQVANQRAFLEANPDMIAAFNALHVTAHFLAAHFLDGQGDALAAPATN